MKKLTDPIKIAEQKMLDLLLRKTKPKYSYHDDYMDALRYSFGSIIRRPENLCIINGVA